MKFLKYLIIIFIVVIFSGLLYVYLQPSAYHIKKTKVIDVTPSMAYSTVNDLKSYELWGPWHDEDSTIVVTYGDKTTGVGASSSWTSAEGPGKMWVEHTKPNEKVDLKLQFGDFEPGDMQWEISDNNGNTEITWVMKEENAPFVFKMAAAFSGGWESMFGPMQEKGLENLEKVLLEQKNKGLIFSFTTPKIISLEPGTFVGIKHSSKIDQEALSSIFMNTMPIVSQQVMAMGFTYEDFTPAAVYYDWDEENNSTTFAVGVYVTKNTEKLENTELLTEEIYASKAVKSSKFGNYGNGDMEAHTAINDFINEQNLDPLMPIMELYVNDPTQVEAIKIQTDIYYPIKE